MRLLEIEIDDQKEAIQKRWGKEVIVRDEHRMWKHGILERDTCPYETYQLNPAGEGETIRLHYHDLITLLEVYRK